MSVETAPRNEAQHDVISSEQLTEMAQVASYVPESVEDAFNTVQIARNALPTLEEAVQDGQLEESAEPVQVLTHIGEQGLNHWKLGEEQVAELKAVSEQGARPSELAHLSEKEWLNMSASQRREVKIRAGKRLDLNAKITRYEVEQQAQADQDKAQTEALAYKDRAETAMMEHLQQISDGAYDAVQAEMGPDTEARLEKARNNPQLGDGARGMLVANLKEKLEIAASEAAQRAVDERQQIIDANGGALGLEKLLHTEEQEAQRKAEEAKKVAWLKHIHGPDYDKKFGPDGEPLSKDESSAAEPHGPVLGPKTEAEHVAQLKRIHGPDFDKKFDEHGVPRKVIAEAEKIVNADTSEQDKWDNFAKGVGDVALSATTEKQSWFKRFKEKRAQKTPKQPKTEKPQKHQWAPRDSAIMRELGGVGGLSKETKAQLLDEERDGLTQKARENVEKHWAEQKRQAEKAREKIETAKAEADKRANSDPSVRTREQIAALLRPQEEEDENT